MLNLTRRVGENIKVFKNDDYESLEMTITILQINGNQVSVGIDSDKIYTFLRDEIYQKVCRERGIEPVQDSYTKEDVIKAHYLKKRAWRDRMEKEREQCSAE